MSKARKLRNKGYTVIRKACATYNWHGFTLQRGHYFWEDEFFYNVSAGIAGRRPGTVVVYQAIKPGIDTDFCRWYKTVLFTSYGDGAALMRMVEEAGGSHVEFKPDRARRKPNNSAGELSFPTYVDKRPTNTARLPRPRIQKTYMDAMLQDAARGKSQGANWAPAVIWKEA